MDGTKDPTGSENVSIIVRYMDKECKVQERLLSMQTTDKCDAQSLTDVVLNELSNAGLDANKILSQCYDGASHSCQEKREACRNLGLGNISIFTIYRYYL